MGFDYALVHLKYTIPPAIVLTFLHRPLCTRMDLYKICFLIGIAVAATTPWDSYLIRRQIWTYPPSVIVGPTLFSIPVEEIFFFVIQTYNTTLLYLLLSKSAVKPVYLVACGDRLRTLTARKYVGQVIITSMIAAGGLLVRKGHEGTYLGLILVWVGPFALLLWTLAYQFLLNLPILITIVPIVVSTLYLSVVDTFALRRGTWTIESDTKLGIDLWDGLEVEEAVFFLATNILIVFGQVAFDNALAILEAFPALFLHVPVLPSPALLMQALLTSPARFDNDRILGIQDAVTRLNKKSRSFYLASAVFSGRLRVNLILLYSFCRVADDLIDNATSEPEARSWVSTLSTFLDLAYAKFPPFDPQLGIPDAAKLHVLKNFPSESQSALLLLPTHILTSRPLYDLLDGFRTDLEFSSTYPIQTQENLRLYSKRVASTISELCLELVFHDSPSNLLISSLLRKYLIRSGAAMGIALQYVNIARDVARDAAIGRVYLPTSWITDEGLEPEDVIRNPRAKEVEQLRLRLLGKAFTIYEEAKGALDYLPAEAKAPMAVAVEGYMEIGRVMGEQGFEFQADKATVPKLRRIMVAWKALNRK